MSWWLCFERSASEQWCVYWPYYVCKLWREKIEAKSHTHQHFSAQREREREMGSEKKMKWAAEEEEALRAGVARYGQGRWKTILRDPTLSPSLSHRTNVHLKDKWRNIMKDRTKTSGTDILINEENRGPAALADNADENDISQREKEAALADNADKSVVSPQEAEAALADNTDKIVVSPQETKATPPYKTLILKAILSTKDPKGSEISAIVKFIKVSSCSIFSFATYMTNLLRSIPLES